MKLRHVAGAALVLAAPATAKAPDIHVSGWARAGATSSAAYVSVHNGGRGADRLIAASSPAAARVSIHDSRNVGGVMRMRAAGPLAVAPNGMITMKPGGLHVMLMGLKAPLKVGARLPLTLRFEKAGAVKVSLPVMAPGSSGPAGGHDGH
ncbi:copper chaperone PCu(A)C [Sphingomonas sp. LHG3406-1]|uniref:copper chaperone PCu(A)C n=1 Tax=Sphingomonas sp. LHG3406-1 TaxID=2804617 RepID=UPI002619E7F8|nr:copper chaperone PCu(A)C [Sphingomonas sp. LHG3406-1]